MNLTEELIQKALDGDLSAAEEREFQRLLDENPELWSQFRKLCDVEVDLRNLDETFDVSERVMAACRPRAVFGLVKRRVDPVARIESAVERWFPRIAISLTAAAAVIIAVVLMQGDPFEPARFAGVEGEVKVMREGNARPAGRIAELKPNDRIVVHGESGTSLRYQDETRIEISERTELIYETDTAFRIGQASSKKLELLAGRVEADVTPQPDGKALVVKTPQAYAIVRGTRFALETDPTRTRLEVSKGRVDLRRLSDGEVVSVGAGNFAIANGNLPFIARPVRSSEGLVAYYAFDAGKGKTIYDRSGHPAALDLRLVTEGNGKGSWLPSGGYSLTEGAALFSENAADQLVAAFRESGALSIEAWVTPAKASQGGPARIVTLSNKSENVNFLLGHGNQEMQRKNAFVARIRAFQNGTEEIYSFDSGGEFEGGLTHLVVTCESGGQLLFYENGKIAAREQLDGDFSTWKKGLKLGLGGDPGDKRFWEGTFHLVALYSRSLSPDDVQRNFESGPVQLID